MRQRRFWMPRSAALRRLRLPRHGM